MLPSCMYGAVSAILLETEIVLSVRSENRQKLKAVRSSNRLLHAGPIFRTLLIQCGTDGKPDRIHVQALPDGRERTWGERSEFLAVAGEVLGLERHPGHFGPAHKVWTTPSIHNALGFDVIWSPWRRRDSGSGCPGGERHGIDKQQKKHSPLGHVPPMQRVYR